jgi:hypothetical protein
LLALLLACPSADDAEGDSTSETADEMSDATDGGECMPAGVFGNCIADGEAACQAAGQTQCPSDNLDNPSLGVCSKHCNAVCDCWAAPATGNAPVACVALVPGDPDQSCVLDCSNGETCPDGMECLDTLSICVWPGA